MIPLSWEIVLASSSLPPARVASCSEWASQPISNIG